MLSICPFWYKGINAKLKIKKEHNFSENTDLDYDKIYTNIL